MVKANTSDPNDEGAYPDEQITMAEVIDIMEADDAPGEAGATPSGQTEASERRASRASAVLLGNYSPPNENTVEALSTENAVLRAKLASATDTIAELEAKLAKAAGSGGKENNGSGGSAGSNARPKKSAGPARRTSKRAPDGRSETPLQQRKRVAESRTQSLPSVAGSPSSVGSL